jgi:hypothetical protein
MNMTVYARELPAAHGFAIDAQLKSFFNNGAWPMSLAVPLLSPDKHLRT